MWVKPWNREVALAQEDGMWAGIFRGRDEKGKTCPSDWLLAASQRMHKASDGLPSTSLSSHLYLAQNTHTRAQGGWEGKTKNFKISTEQVYLLANLGSAMGVTGWERAWELRDRRGQLHILPWWSCVQPILQETARIVTWKGGSHRLLFLRMPGDRWASPGFRGVEKRRADTCSSPSAALSSLFPGALVDCRGPPILHADFLPPWVLEPRNGTSYSKTWMARFPN